MTDEGKIPAREESSRRLAESMKRQLGVFCALLSERDVVELTLNASGRMWVDRLGRSMARVRAMPVSAAESFIVSIASTLCGTITWENPILECKLPQQQQPFDGSRFEALILPVVSRSQTTNTRAA